MSAGGFPELEVAAPEAASRLLGAELCRRLDDGTELRGQIVETEAYDQTDAASHSYKGRTPRSDVMFGPAGFLYVYFTYGMHYCCNVVSGADGQGSAALIRAVEPLEGLEVMRRNRGGRADHSLTDGPAKVCHAFGIDKALNGHDLRRQPLTLQLKPPLAAERVATSVRIGIRQAADIPWRFYIKDNPFVSRKAGSA